MAAAATGFVQPRSVHLQNRRDKSNEDELHDAIGWDCVRPKINMTRLQCVGIFNRILVREKIGNNIINRHNIIIK